MVKIHSIEQLKSELHSKAFEVEWKVLCEIGPDWIGGSRKVCFYLDDQPLDDSEFHTMLIEQLINKLSIPSTNEKYVIEGTGELTIINSSLVVKYTTAANIPYDVNYLYSSGEVVLLTGV